MRYFIVQVSANVNYSPSEIELVALRTFGKKFFKKFDLDPSDIFNDSRHKDLFMSEKALSRLVEMNSTLSKKGKQLVIQIHDYREAPAQSKWYWRLDGEDVYVSTQRYGHGLKVCEVDDEGNDNELFNENVIEYIGDEFKEHLVRLSSGGYVNGQLISDLLDEVDDEGSHLFYG